jgi:hypothetical protein
MEDPHPVENIDRLGCPRSLPPSSKCLDTSPVVHNIKTKQHNFGSEVTIRNVSHQHNLTVTIMIENILPGISQNSEVNKSFAAGMSNESLVVEP